MSNEPILEDFNTSWPVRDNFFYQFDIVRGKISLEKILGEDYEIKFNNMSLFHVFPIHSFYRLL